MPEEVLATRPEHDDTTFYLSKWCEKTLKHAQERGITIIDLVKENANKNKFDGIISKKNPKLIILNGHGNENSVTGHKDEILIETDSNESILKSKIFYAVSCRSARKLGPKAIEKGALAYIGYDDDFIFVIDKNKTATPLKDDYAKLFLEPSNEVALSLIKGNCTKESYLKSQNMFKKNIQKLLTSESPPGSENWVRYLFWDMKHQTILGDKNACFE